MFLRHIARLTFNEGALPNCKLDTKLGKVRNGGELENNECDTIPSTNGEANQETGKISESTCERGEGKGASVPIDNDQ